MTATTTNKLPADMTPAEQAFASRILDEETIRVTTTTETVYVIAVVTNKATWSVSTSSPTRPWPRPRRRHVRHPTS